MEVWRTVRRDFNIVILDACNKVSDDVGCSKRKSLCDKSGRSHGPGFIRTTGSYTQYTLKCEHSELRKARQDKLPIQFL